MPPLKAKEIYLRERLSPRSTQVLQLLGRGLTDREVAERLRITLGTLRNYLPFLRMMLPVSSLEEMRRAARDWALGRSGFSRDQARTAQAILNECPIARGVQGSIAPAWKTVANPADSASQPYTK